MHHVNCEPGDVGILASAIPSLSLNRHHQATIFFGEALVIDHTEVLHEMQIMIRGQYRDVAQPGCQQRQFCLNVNTISVPTNQRIDGAAVTKIVNPGAATIDLPDSGTIEQNTQVPPEPSAGVCTITAVWT